MGEMVIKQCMEWDALFSDKPTEQTAVGAFIGPKIVFVKCIFPSVPRWI
jgi:hypothetical protein